MLFDAYAADAKPAATTATTQASDAADTPYDLSAEKMMMDNLLILGMLFFIFYFILIRPQQRRLKAQKELMKSLQKGYKVMTVGGVIGTIAKFEGDDVVVLEVAPTVKIRVSRVAITDVVSDKPSGESANDN